MTGTPSNTGEGKCKVPWAGYGTRDKKTDPQAGGPTVATSRKLQVPHMIGSARDRFRT